MSRNESETLLARWSRLKRASATHGGEEATAPKHGTAETRRDSPGKSSDNPASVGTDEALPALPSIDELNADSDFQPFMDPRVDDGMRRAALKKLFRNPDFNVCDGLDVYAEDYTKLEKLTPAMVAALKYAQRNLFGEQDKSEAQANRSGGAPVADIGKNTPAEDDPAGVTGAARERVIADVTGAPDPVASGISESASSQLAVEGPEQPHSVPGQLPRQTKKS